MRNPVDGRVERPAGGGWDLHVEQVPFGHDQSGFHGPATVMIDWHDAEYNHVTYALTTGEIRVLVAQLLHLADMVDLHG